MALVNITAGVKGVNLEGGGVELVAPGAALVGTPAPGEADDLILVEWFAEVIEVEAKVAKGRRVADPRPTAVDEAKADA